VSSDPTAVTGRLDLPGRAALVLSTLVLFAAGWVAGSGLLGDVRSMACGEIGQPVCTDGDFAAAFTTMGLIVLHSFGALLLALAGVLGALWGLDRVRESEVAALSGGTLVSGALTVGILGFSSGGSLPYGPALLVAAPFALWSAALAVRWRLRRPRLLAREAAERATAAESAGAAPPGADIPGPTGTGGGLIRQLERLAVLHREGRLTDKEFARAKKLLLTGGTEPGLPDLGPR
jgi:hypothetical protein